MAFVLYSYLWNSDPAVILDRNREVLQMLSFAFYISSRFSLLDQLYIMSAAFGLGGFFSLFYAVAQPSVGVHIGGPHDGSWKGIFAQKNVLGRFSLLSFSAFLILQYQGKPLVKNLARLFIAIFVILLLQTTSKSALGNLFILIGIFCLLYYTNWRGKKQVVFVSFLSTIAYLVYSVVISNWVSLLTSIGRDPTLTGRTYIWSFAIESLRSDPSKLLFGYGRGIFFDPSAGFIQGFSKYIPGYLPPHAHNGFIDMILEIGIVGFGLFVICYVNTYRTYLKKATITGDTLYVFPLVALAFLAIYNITESILIRGTSLYWTVFLVLLFSANRGKVLVDNEISSDRSETGPEKNS